MDGGDAYYIVTKDGWRIVPTASEALAVVLDAEAERSPAKAYRCVEIDRSWLRAEAMAEQEQASLDTHRIRPLRGLIRPLRGLNDPVRSLDEALADIEKERQP